MSKVAHMNAYRANCVSMHSMSNRWKGKAKGATYNNLVFGLFLAASSADELFTLDALPCSGIFLWLLFTIK